MEEPRKLEMPDNHYKDCILEPIEVMRKILTEEQFNGFLLGNIIKYRFRAGHKTDGDLAKAMQYETWYKEINK